ncbi:MAG: hypothetical protein JSR82_08575 [Verrucomicrobia bacterium]|nr:hypothetical protein [Verrucomicrobiota bacterium]
MTHSKRFQLLPTVSALTLSLLAFAGPAAAEIWTGAGGNPNLSDGANWADGLPPVSGTNADLTFASGTGMTNDTGAAFSLQSAYFYAIGAPFTISGSPLVFTGTPSIANTGNFIARFTCDVTLGAPLTFGGGGFLVFDGAVTDPSNFGLNVTNTYVTELSGTFQLGNVTTQNGSYVTFTGNGTITGGVIGNGSALVAFGGDATKTRTLTAGASLNAPNGLIQFQGGTTRFDGYVFVGPADFDFVGGTVDGTGQIDFNLAPADVFSFNQGALLGDGTQTASVNGGFFQFNGVVGTQTIGRELIVRSSDVRFNNGDVQLTGSGRLTIDATTAQVRNSNFRMTGASTANQLRLTNGGALQKTAGSGTGTFTLDANLDLGSGTLQVDAGIVRLNAGSVLPAGSTLAPAFITEIDFSGGTHFMNGATMIGQGNIALSGGTLLTDPNSSPDLGSVVGSLELRGGTLTGGNNQFVSPAVSWNASTLTTTFAAPTVAATVVPTFLALSGSTSRTLDRRSIFATGGGNWVGGDLVISGGDASNFATFTLAGTGGVIFYVQSDQSILPGAGGYAVFSIQSGNRFIKQSSFGTTTVAVPIINSGGLEANSGRLLLTGGSYLTGLAGGLVIGSGATLELGGGDFILNFPAWLGSGGTLAVSGATTSVNIANNASVGNASTQLDLNDGTLTGINFNLFGSQLNWAGVRFATTLNAPIVGQTNVYGPLNLVGDANHVLDRRSLFLASGGSWTGQGDLILSGGNASSPAFFNLNANGSIFRLQTDRSIVPGTGPGQFSVNNGARLIKDTTTGTSTIAVPMSSNGSIEVATGRLLFTGGTIAGNSLGGNITLSSGATFEFGGGTFTLFPNIAGSGGNLVVSGASTSLVLGNNANFGNPTTRLDLLEGTLTGIISNFFGSSVNWAGTLLTTNLTAPLMGQTNVYGPLNLVGDANHVLDRRSLFLSAGGSWTGQGDLILSGGNASNPAFFNLNATGSIFRLQTDRSILPGTGPGQFSVNNSSRLIKDTTTGTSTIAVPMSSNGSIEVATGRLLLTGGTIAGNSLGGNITLFSGATFEFGGGTFTLFPNIVGSGGNLVVSGTSTSLALGNNTNFGNPSTRLDLLEGTLTGIISNLFGSSVNWAGTLLTTNLAAPLMGQSTVFGPLNLVGDANHVLDRRSLFVSAGGSWAGQGDLILSGGNASSPAFFNLNANGSIFRLQTDRSILPGTGPGQFSVNNGARLIKDTTTGTSTIAVPMSSNGSIEVTTGRLLLTGGTIAGNSLGGNITLSSGAICEFGGGTFTLFPNIVGSGGNLVVSGTSTSLALGNNANFGNPTTRLDLLEGTLTGIISNLFGSSVNWAGTLLTTNLTTPQVGQSNVYGPLNLVGDANHVLDRRSLFLSAGGTWTGLGDLVLLASEPNTPVTFSLSAGGSATFRLQTDRSIVQGPNFGANVSIAANNRLVKELSNGTSTIDPCLQLFGTLEAASGTLRLTATCSSNNGLLRASSGGTLRVEGNFLGSGNVTVDQGGTLVLSGSIYSTGQNSIAGTLDLRGGGLGNTPATTTIQVGGRVVGGGALYGTVINNGTISTTDSIAFVGAITNNGVMRFRGGGRAQFYGPSFVNNGVLDVITGNLDFYNGTTFVNNGVVLDSSVVKVKRTTVSGNQVNIVVDGYAEHVFQLQYSPDLTTPFADLGAPQTGTGGELTFSDSLGGGRGFYRVVVDPAGARPGM